MTIYDMELAGESSIAGPMSWFPYTPRPHQVEAVEHAAEIFADQTVGLLSAECGVGKTVAVLSAYIAMRSSPKDWDDMRLIILTRTHSQSDVFESELGILKQILAKKGRTLTATSMISREHICPLKENMKGLSNTGFTRACAKKIKTNQCDYYWDFYKRDQRGSVTITRKSLDIVERLLTNGIVSREVAVHEAKDEGICPYELLRWCAKSSKVIIGPYGYMFIERVRNAFLSSLQVKFKRLDMVIDEAHNLASFVLDSEAAILTGLDLQYLRDHKAKILSETKASWLVKTIDFLWETIQLSLDKLKRKKEVQLEKWDVIPRFIEVDQLNALFENENLLGNDMDSVGFSETPLERLLHFLYTGMRVVEGHDWHTTIEAKKWDNVGFNLQGIRLRIRPLNAAGFSAKVLWGCRSALLMSGTLRPIEHYAQLLGIAGAKSIDIPGPYPKDSRMILIDREVTTRYKNRSQDTWRLIARRIRTALTTMPADKSALIAFPSYDILNAVLSYNILDKLDLGFRQRIVETRHAQLDELREMLLTGPTAIFCVYGGKFSEGIDLVEDGSSMLNLIIGVGIPYSPPSSFQSALQEWYAEKFGNDSGFYFSSVIPSIRRVAQLIGRLQRSPSDWGVVLLLDKRFENHIRVLGNDIESNLWPFRGEEEMVTAIRLFIESHSREDTSS